MLYYIIFTRWSCKAFPMVFWKSNERKHRYRRINYQLAFCEVSSVEPDRVF